MQTMPLNEFLTRFVPSNPAPPPLKWTRYHRGVDERQSKFPEYASLRAMAEWACSIRGEPKYFICKKGETTFGPPQEKFPEVGPEDIVVPVLTPTVPDGRQPLGGVWVQAEGAAEFMNLAWTGDAMFWSTGAVEQFLCPYYASKVGLEAMNTVATLADYWLGTRQIPTAGADETVAGLIHLYTSEWVIETSTGAIIDEPLTDTTSTLGLEAVSPTQQLGALTVDIAGNTYLRRLVG
ncbi:MAG TPA: hypothetical protein VFR37_17445, partial [Longimicrobium sp.]|nr:hypothetical protein [Longimicrobium sp.]